MNIGKHPVAIGNATLRVPVEMIADWPWRADNHHFTIQLPDMPPIPVIFRGEGEDGDMAPFFVEKPEELKCGCGASITDLVRAYGKNWYTKHNATCPLCHIEQALHVSPGKEECLACHGTGVVKSVSLGSSYSYTSSIEGN